MLAITVGLCDVCTIVIPLLSLPTPLLTPTVCSCTSGPDCPPLPGWTWVEAPSCTESSGRWSGQSCPPPCSCSPSPRAALSPGSLGSGSRSSEGGLAPGAARLSCWRILAVSSPARAHSHTSPGQLAGPQTSPSSSPLAPPCST